MKKNFNDGGRAELEKNNPDAYAKIEELRKERDKYNEKAYECQKEIDDIYNSISKFDSIVGKVVDLVPPCEHANGVYELALVTNIVRLSWGARLEGKSIVYDENNYSKEDPYISYCTYWSDNVSYTELEELKTLDGQEFTKVIELAKAHM